MSERVSSLERDGDRAYFTDAAGDCYRVHDVFYHEHKKHIVSLESARANHRYFVGESGIARAYRFAKAESHALTTELLTVQLSGAGFIATTPRDRGALRPT